jgi:hypothetical protein
VCQVLHTDLNRIRDFTGSRTKIPKEKCIFWASSHLHLHIWSVNLYIKIRAVLFFALSNNFSFLYLSLYTAFESETWQFTETFEIDFGKNSLRFLWQYIYTF